MISEREGEFKMSKPKINLSHIGINNEDILSQIAQENKDLMVVMLQYINEDKKFFSLLWDSYDICFDRDSKDYIKQDIYSNDTYVKDSVEYNYVLEKIIREYHSYNKNGNNAKSRNSNVLQI